MNRICIVFPGGSYGTFLDWCLNYFSKPDFDPRVPFRSTGSSHEFDGNHITVEELYDLGRDHELETVRLHPKIRSTDNIFAIMESIVPYFEKIVYLHPTERSMAWTINNKFEKVWEEGWPRHYETQFQDNLQAWNKQTFDAMAVWEQREFLSTYIYEQHWLENEIGNLEQLKSRFDQLLFVDIADLRDNFSLVLERIFAYWGKDPANLDKLDSIYSTWINLQRHRYKDRDIDTVVRAVVQDKDHDWSDLQFTMVDEALIQMHLRNQGLEIRCFDLDQFPKSTQELRPYLYVA